MNNDMMEPVAGVVSAMRSYALALQAENNGSESPAWRALRTVAGRIERLQLDLDELEDRADELVAQIEEDDVGALCLLTVAECAAMHALAGDVLARACDTARLAGYSDEQLGDVLGVHRTTVARRFG